jgi:hypothetical protein
LTLPASSSQEAEPAASRGTPPLEESAESVFVNRCVMPCKEVAEMFGGYRETYPPSKKEHSNFLFKKETQLN